MTTWHRPVGELPWFPGMPLRSFSGGSKQVPYTFKVDPRTQPSRACPQGAAFRVFPVRLKTGYATSSNKRLIHDVIAAAAYIDGENVLHFGARWLCGGGSTGAILLPTHRIDGLRCRQCEETRAGNNRAPGVYRFFDAAGEPLYIGSSATPGDRIVGHARAKTSARWWPLVASVQVTHYTAVDLARFAEGMAILRERPRFNKQAVIPLLPQITEEEVAA